MRNIGGDDLQILNFDPNNGSKFRIWPPHFLEVYIKNRNYKLSAIKNVLNKQKLC